jgi:glutamate-1-semialdehyde aminotransferase/spore coat polysaccharide biosynthesis protein SpsF (cytidylyltransferase family)
MIVAVIQVRTGSSRLPGKAIKEINGRPMFWHQIERTKLAKSLDQIIVATTDQPEDQPIIAVAQEAGVQWTTGSVDDVLDRVYQAVKDTGATEIVRLTGDCPMVDPVVIDQVVEYFLSHKTNLDYACLSPEWPEGFDIEILSFDVLERAWHEATKQYEREHVTPYVTMSGKFLLYQIPCSQDLSHLRLTVDEPIDFDVVNDIYQELYPKYGHEFGLSEILDLFDRRPEVFKPNMSVQRNDGLLNSLDIERKPLRYDPKPTLKNTDAIWSRAEPLIPAGTQTLSKGPTQYVQGVAPKYLQRGQGSHVWDADDNEYIDYPMGLGSVILGHSYPRVNEAITRQLQDGMSFSLMHPLEVELAELLVSVIPWAEMVRYGKNGSDATTGAIRAARAYTGREKVFHCGYHGWHDWYIAGTTRNKGVPQGSIDLQFDFPYNDLTKLKELFDEHHGQVAAVIMEPYRTVAPEPGFLEGVKDLAHANGAILIYDEVASGFRFRLGGINEIYGVTPDIGCFGKAIGNGMPISAIVGHSEVMNIFDELFFSFTFGGECLSLAASIATIKELQDKDIYTHTWAMGRRLMEGYNRMAWDLKIAQNTQIVGLPALTVPTFLDQSGNPSLLLKSLFQQEAIKRGVLFGAAHCISYSHSETDIDMTLAAYYEALLMLKKALDIGDVESLLDGPPVSQVFRPQI